MADDADGKVIITKDWTSPGQVIHITMDDLFRGMVHFDGKGSMEGAKAFVDLMDEIRDEVGHDTRVDALVDLRDVYRTPLRAQYLIGKWFLGRKEHFNHVAIFGGKRIEMAIARFVTTMARFKGAKFFKEQTDATRWLGWPDDLYPR